MQRACLNILCIRKKGKLDTLMVCLSIEFLKLEFNSYLLCEFRDLTLKKKLNKI
jgi:hypothetical protein